MKLSPATLLLSLALLLGACESSTNLPEPPHTPKVALTYSLSNQDTSQVDGSLLRSRQLFVSASQRVFNPRFPESRADATVEITDATGAVVERFVPATFTSSGQQSYRYQYGPGHYLPTLGLVGQPGATYTLRATAPGLPPATSTMQLPAVPVIKNATFTPRSRDGARVSGRFAITLADDPAVANYYLVYVRAVYAQPQRQIPVSNYLNTDDTNDLGVQVDDFRLSQPTDYSRYGPEPYPDTNVNGREFTLSTTCSYADYSAFCSDPTQCPGQILDYLEVRVSSITADTYRFYQSEKQSFASRDNPFAEPASLLSNVSPGYGLFGGATDAVYRLRL